MIIDTMGKSLSWLVPDVHKLMIFAIYDLLFFFSYVFITHNS